ncbi:MAG TPA: TonB family protein [Thermoanaerobaculia bacterium]|jgi:protein TonB|nr:TonB family protein [Thermoanaerobaculia bacterium]
MAASKKPYEQFGPFILFRKLEQDALGDLWRAAAIENGQLGTAVALRRLTGGNREALVAAATAARDIAPLLSGTSFVKDQVIDVVGGVPFIAYEYAIGRSLRQIVDRARGGNGVTPNPIPIDQAIVIAEKVALSVATTADLRYLGNRLSHGALIPHFVWISDDGEIRVAGQQLGKGIIASLKEPAFGAAISRYFSPEYQSSGESSKGSEVYSLGALLYLLVTGAEPPDAANASAFAQAVRAAKMMNGTPIPDDIRILLDKSLNIDPSRRYASIADMKQALSMLTNSGKYSATTFNLAFYLSNLLKKELEVEALEREKESKLNVAPYLDSPAGHAPSAAAVAVPSFGAPEETDAPRKSRLPLALAAIGALVAIGLGGWVAMGGLKSKPAAAPAPAVQAAAVPQQQKPAFVPPPVVVASSTAPAATTATTTADAEAERKKAFEAAVEQKMQQEMLKLQADYLKTLQQQKSKNAPVVTAGAMEPAPAVTPRNQPPASPDSSVSAAQLDQQRREAARTDAPAVPAPAPITTSQPSAPAIAQPAPQPAPLAARVTREGDVIDFQELDTQPKALSVVRPSYPQLAIRQRVEGTIILTVLISETGEVADVRVLRGIDKFGMNEAAIRALRNTRFSSPMKDGKRVKTWFPQSVQFKL